MVVLDLFSGAGGLSEGFFRVNSQFIGHVEADAYACKTLKTRSAYWKLKNNNKSSKYNDYLLKKFNAEKLWKVAKIDAEHEIINKTICDDTMPLIFNDININMDRNNLSEVDVIIGGPPCQAYSIVGRARMKEAVVNDHRNFLYKYYVQFLDKYNPKIFVFENVPGLRSAGNGEYYKHLKVALNEAGEGYELKEFDFIANEYGVLQNRKRIIIVGIRKDIYNLKDKELQFEKIKLNKSITVNDVLKDLPKTNPGSLIEGKDKYIEPSNDYLKLSSIRNGRFNILTQHETRPHNDRDREIYREAITSWNENKSRLCYKELSTRRPELITHKNTETFTNRFNVVKSDLQASHTILAHMAMDGHYYIHPDEKQLRSLSIREAARLQSFPDDYYFEGPRTSIFRQIGNAVPPKMAEQIALGIKDYLK